MSQYVRLSPRLDIIGAYPIRPGMDTSGMIELTDEQAAQVTALRAARKMPIWYDGRVTTADAEKIRWDFRTDAYAPIPTPPIPVRTISKLAIRRQLRAWGMEAAFEAVLDAVPHARADWNDCQDIRTNDPLFVAHKDDFKAALGLSDEQFAALLEPPAEPTQEI